MSAITRSATCLVLLGFLVGYHGVTNAQQPSAAPAAEATTPDEPMKAAFAAARLTKVSGPADVALKDQATLHLPAKYVFVPAKEAALILRAMGNRTSDELIGVIFPADSDSFIALQYEASGYIKDDDAKDWNADELLSNLRAGTEESNQDRKARGMSELEITGWVERPHYDASAHQLKWSLSSRHKGAPETADQGINYNTYALGREGFISMNLVTDLKAVEAEKPMVSELLAGLKFNGGKSYTDFNSTTDKVAEYGLAALIGGIAAKKLGLLALAGVFFVKFFKLIVAGGLAIAGGVFKYWRRKPAPVPVAATPVATTFDAPAFDATVRPVEAPPDTKQG